MAVFALNDNFNYFFGRLNPGPSFELQAAREYASVKGLLENRLGPAAVLAPLCFLQGSYRQETAIYTINDVDLVVLCRLWYPGSGRGSGWSRDQIFDTIASPLRADTRYREKVHYTANSMCIKVDLGIRLEILPVVFRAGNEDPASEPFYLWRPERSQWEPGFARQHQQLLTAKNATARTQNNFKPAIKVVKHLRSRFGIEAVSFHIECLLYHLPDRLFIGGPADYIPTVLGHIGATSADEWYAKVINTPCGDRDIFVPSEWTHGEWRVFHEKAVLWARCARFAAQATNRNDAIEAWQLLLGEDRFPARTS